MDMISSENVKVGFLLHKISFHRIRIPLIHTYTQKGTERERQSLKRKMEKKNIETDRETRDTERKSEEEKEWKFMHIISKTGQTR